MTDDAVADRLSFLGRRLPPAFELRVVSVAPGGERPYDEEEWRDALVVVERGEIELEASAGGRVQFGPGSVLWLFGLPLRALHNRGAEPALVVAVSRRR
jgi:quercetin dioxygenase-like cupin family protein